MTSLPSLPLDPPPESTTTRCSVCAGRFEASELLAIGDKLACSECEHFAACDYYAERDGRIPGRDAIGLAGVFVRLAASIYKGVVQAEAGNVTALDAVRWQVAAPRDFSTVYWSAVLAIEEASGRADSADARFARAALAGDAVTMAAHVREDDDRKFRERLAKEQAANEPKAVTL